jgi:hypothetical protein
VVRHFGIPEAGVTQPYARIDPLSATVASGLEGSLLHFTSICPKCKEGRTQRGYTRTALANLLNSGYQIEAYCVGCDEFWPISAQERRSIADALGELVHRSKNL